MNYNKAMDILRNAGFNPIRKVALKNSVTIGIEVYVSPILRDVKIQDIEYLLPMMLVNKDREEGQILIEKNL